MVLYKTTTKSKVKLAYAAKLLRIHNSQVSQFMLLSFSNKACSGKKYTVKLLYRWSSAGYILYIVKHLIIKFRVNKERTSLFASLIY